MEGRGFKRGRSSPCIFYHKARNLRAVIHGDDFTILGHDEDLDWFREQVAEEFEAKFKGRLGPKESHCKEICVLNRVVQWNELGIKYEADVRHVEIILRDLGINEDSNNSRVPGTSEIDWELRGKKLGIKMSTAYRALVARGIYLGQDRSDIGLSLIHI